MRAPGSASRALTSSWCFLPSLLAGEGSRTHPAAMGSTVFALQRQWCWVLRLSDRLAVGVAASRSPGERSSSTEPRLGRLSTVCADRSSRVGKQEMFV